MTAVGRDPAGRALVEAIRADGATVRPIRVAGKPTGRIGVVVMFGGERSFVADRGAADELRPDDLKPGWFAVDLVHLPAYSLIGSPLGDAGRRAIELARAAGALVSLDLASAAPLLAKGRRAAHRLVDDAAPDLLFSTAGEAEAFLGGYDVLGPAGLGAARGRQARREGRDGPRPRRPGAPLRFEVATPSDDRRPTRPAPATRSTRVPRRRSSPSRRATRLRPAALRRAALAGHRAATRQLTAGSPELSLR